jgi:hypothetical protein
MEIDRMTVQELEKAVAKLSPKELAEFREWFYSFEEDEWDRQIARDAEMGKLDKFTEEAIADYETGRVKGAVRHFTNSKFWAASKCAKASR